MSEMRKFQKWFAVAVLHLGCVSPGLVLLAAGVHRAVAGVVA